MADLPPSGPTLNRLVRIDIGGDLTPSGSGAPEIPIDPTLVDPYWADVVFLSHFDILSDDLTITDISSANVGSCVITAGSGGAISSDAFKWSPTALNCTKAGLQVTSILNSGAFNRPSGLNLTYEFWFLNETVGGSDFDSGYFFIADGDVLRLAVQGATAFGVAITKIHLDNLNYNVGAFSLNEWHHLALVIVGNDVTVYVDGELQLTVANGASILPSFASLCVGGPQGSANVNWAMDDLRITRGVARYTANFTPPPAPFPNRGP